MPCATFGMSEGGGALPPLALHSVYTHRASWCAHCAPAVTSSPFSSQGTCDLSHVLNYNAFPSKSLLSFHPTALQRRIRAEWLCARQGSARRIGGAGAVAGKRLRGGGEEGLCVHLQPAAVTAVRSHHPIRQVEVGALSGEAA